MKKISIPELSLVVLMGSSGSGKSTFARRHFLSTEIISSDHCRGLVSDDENSMEATESAFAVLHFIAAERLKRGKLTVIDATNVQKEARAPLLELAKKYHCLAVVIALDTPEKICLERNASRPDRNFGPHVVRRHCAALRRSLRSLSKEGFRYVHVLSMEDANAVEIERQPLWNNRKKDLGPFDVIGDVHGCAGELELLLRKLGYEHEGYNWHHPEGRRVIFVGDLVDRGPRVMDVLQIAMAMTAAGNALCVPGNHDAKLLHYLQGRQVQIKHGLEQTITQLERTFTENQQIEFQEKVKQFLDSLVSHYVLDDGNLVVAHAGLKEELQGRASGAVRAFTLFGDTTGETDENGLPVRLDWAKDYRGKASVVYGHTPVSTPVWHNNTLNIDTGCVFGGALTALRWPGREVESVPAQQKYAEPGRPFPGNAAAERGHDVLDITDVSGKRIIATRLMNNITIREENAMAALEVMSRFAAPPQWLIYLPPTMSPCGTSLLPGTLEHPAEAFDYFRKNNVEKVICEEKHMGSRAVIIVCRDVSSAQKRFGTQEDRSGIIFTRTGRPFFSQGSYETEILSHLQQAIEKADLWKELNTDWICLDAELMPWSLKAHELIQQQYAPVAVAARAALNAANETLRQAAQSGLDVKALEAKYQRRQEMIERYERVTQLYNWEVDSVQDIKLAPFHLLASEGQVHIDKNHLWHLAQIQKIVDADTSKVLFTTAHRVVRLDGNDEQNATNWWEEITAAGSEGMVVKPLDFMAPGKTFIQPAIKCRGREYLRLIYGPEYDEPKHLQHLRKRGLSHKRSMAAREFALGIEALERFVNGEPLHRVHECAFAVLAMESEPVDPRL